MTICLLSDTDLPPSYDIAAKLPTYEEVERVKEQRDDLVSHTCSFIIQQISVMPIDGQEVIVIRHPYIKDILRYT